MVLIDKEQRSFAEVADRRASAENPASGQPRGERDRPRTNPSDDGVRRTPEKADNPSAFRRRLAAIRRHPLIASAAAIGIVAALVAVTLWWLNARHYESTDDAFIDTRTVPISAQVAGDIVAVPVTDNELVAPGSVLMRIDPRDYQAALAEAQAKLDAAQANVANLDAQIAAQHAKIDQAQKQVVAAQAASDYSRQQQQRAADLLTRGAGTSQAAQQAESDLTQKRAALSGAQANAVAVEKQLAVLSTQREGAQAQSAQARAGLMQAQTNLDRTTIRAPEEGRVAKLSAAKGAYTQPGQSQMMFVPRNVWVTANFKETQLGDMRVGQPATISVDAYPGKTFRGHVDSVQPGSGTVFSLLPAENATGNFVKVVQRVPVKIVFDKAPGVYLGPGMSVEPSVKVR
jgi:membrane fusion protein (multidrug efflux system)